MIDHPGRWLLIAAALLGIALQILLPPWQGEDEPWHLEVAHWIARGSFPTGGGAVEYESQVVDHPASALLVNGRFPGVTPQEAAAWQAEVLASMETHDLPARVDWAQFSVDGRSLDEFQYAYTRVQQPAAYYLLTGALLAPFRVGDPAAELRLARLLSLPLYLLTIAFALALGREVFRDPRAAFLTGVIVALFPINVRQAAIVNNDALAQTVCAGVLWLSARLVRDRLGRRGLALLIGLCVLSLFTKGSATAALWVCGLAVALRPRGERTRARAMLTVAAVAGLALLAIAALWYQDSPFVPHTWQDLQQRVDRGASLASFRKTWQSLIGTFGWEHRLLPGPVYSLTLAAAVAGCALAPLGARRMAAGVRPLLLCVAAIATQVALPVLGGGAMERYARPALPALAVLLACGWLGLAPTRARGRVTAALAAVLLGLLAAWIGGGLVYHQWARWGA